MVRRSDLDAEAARLDKLYRAKARGDVAVAEAMAAGPGIAATRGDLLAEIALLKGEPSAADLEGSRIGAGEDGDAAVKALQALGYDGDAVFWACTRPGAGEPDALARRVAALVEAVDPRAVIALDPAAAADLGGAFGVSLRAGEVSVVRGRRLLALSGLEESLGDQAAKGRVWKEFQALGKRSAQRS